MATLPDNMTVEDWGNFVTALTEWFDVADRLCVAKQEPTYGIVNENSVVEFDLTHEIIDKAFDVAHHVRHPVLTVDIKTGVFYVMNDSGRYLRDETALIDLTYSTREASKERYPKRKLSFWNR